MRNLNHKQDCWLVWGFEASSHVLIFAVIGHNTINIPEIFQMSMVFMVALACSDWPRGVFAWEYVNMIVASRCFAFHALITQARIWKSFRVENLTNLLNYPFLCRLKLGKLLQRRCVHFFSLKLTFQASRKVRILESIFLQNKNWLRVQDFVDKTLQLVRISLLISAIQRVLSFFSRKVFYKSNRKLFSCVCIAWYKH